MAVYFITDVEYIKIGKANNPYQRVKDMQVGNAREIILLAYYKDYNYKLEHYLHKRFSHLKVKGEWYKPSKEIKRFLEYRCNNYELFKERFFIYDKIQNQYQTWDIQDLFQNARRLIHIKDSMKSSSGRFIQGSPSMFVGLWQQEDNLPEIFKPIKWKQNSELINTLFE